jgi:hypothetical protein
LKKYKPSIGAILLLFALCATTTSAQQTVIASGTTASGNNGSITYTIGIMAYTAQMSATGSVSQGMQQAFEISTVTALEEAENITLKWAVYPNPTTDLVVLTLNEFKSNNLQYLLHDISGRTIDCRKIDSDETQITMNQLNSGIYLLSITDNQSVVKTFKIIKN